jgi:hypothetical protein
MLLCIYVPYNLLWTRVAAYVHVAWLLKGTNHYLVNHRFAVLKRVDFVSVPRNLTGHSFLLSNDVLVTGSAVNAGSHAYYSSDVS